MPAPAPSFGELVALVERALVCFGIDGAEARGDETVATQLARWAELVSVWNRRIDLTAARSAEELVDLLVADAAWMARAHAPPERKERERWIDVGSGAGAPGLALALLRPDIAMTLVEPRAKRVAFLRTVIATLGRTDVRIERARSEDLADASCDVAVSRATLAPEIWVREGARLAQRFVWVLLAQGEVPPAPERAQLDRDERYVWPLTGAARRAVRYRLEPTATG
ncbi:MAG TPA: RsmG family class I SAM-dependent methyltransferase [Polyangiaceae bacterium]|nr:RsmG family class I SAM-dependent methyltransferase [Polyangiaceae bacterium]